MILVKVGQDEKVHPAEPVLLQEIQKHPPPEGPRGAAVDHDDALRTVLRLKDRDGGIRPVNVQKSREAVPAPDDVSPYRNICLLMLSSAPRQMRFLMLSAMRFATRGSFMV